MGTENGLIEGHRDSPAYQPIFGDGDREDGWISGSDQIVRPLAWKYHGDI